MLKTSFLGFFLFFIYETSTAQRVDKQVIQFTGLVVSGDSLYGVPNVNIFVPGTVRGVSTDRYGYFSLPTLAGDSIVVSCIGFQNAGLRIPIFEEDQGFTEIIELLQDTTELPEVLILPLPPPDKFVEAFLALKLPREDMDNFQKNFNKNLLRRLFVDYRMDGKENSRMALSMQADRITYDNQVVMNPLLNPFAWVRFIQAIKDGEFKRDRWKDEEDE